MSTAQGTLERRRRLRAKGRPTDFPLDTHWLLTDPDVLGLTRDECAGMLRVIAATWQTSERGVMDEEQLRVWAGYSPDEWTAHRTPMLRLFRSLPGNRLVFREVRRVAEAQSERVRKARRASEEALRAKFKRGAAGSGQVLGKEQKPRKAVRQAGHAAGDQARAESAPAAPAATGTTGPGPDAVAVSALVAGVASRISMRAGP